MNGLLQDKVVLVTGGSSGIGRGICQAAAHAGARVVICADIRPDPREGGPPTADLVQAAGRFGVYCPLDVRSSEAIAAVMTLAKSYGGVDLMVCNAGIALIEDILTTTEEDYRRLMQVNLDGVYFTAQAAAQQMVERGRGGNLVLISSMGGIRGSAATPAYSATKGAVRLLAASMADALGPKGIRVNAVCPGIIDTALVNDQDEAFLQATAAMVARTPLRRKAAALEVGQVVAWLGSDLASFVTGASIAVDGGLSAVL